MKFEDSGAADDMGSIYPEMFCIFPDYESIMERWIILQPANYAAEDKNADTHTDSCIFYTYSIHPNERIFGILTRLHICAYYAI